MALDKQQKLEIIKKFGANENDTGSPAVQIALLTARIKYLTEHFKEHPKDFHSRRGLLKLVGQRRKLLRYLKEHNFEDYKRVVTELGLKG
ncbi:30S ribosomal protein S15 [Hippea jasoniae]|uniref:30S ribosomal protein S15 n=1 Tax=Hippea jasoniae TaxID=944479 RepID=UPI000558B651|nr:30S ribosomal protein S15 [Hippea jasoniae]